MAYCKVFFLLFIINYCLFIAAGFESSDIRNYLGTRTPYRFVANKDDSPFNFPGCIDTKIWMIIRHGTRLPKTKDVLRRSTVLKDLKYEVLRQHKFGKGQLSPEQLRNLDDWEYDDIDPDRAYDLTREGEDEMILMAENMQKRFPNAIKDKYDNKTFKFRYTATQRAQQSARHFALGLFDKKGSQDVVYDPVLKIDPVLRFYKYCDKWKKQIEKNPETYEQWNKFVKSQEMNDTLNAISKKLGLDHVLPLKTAILMYKECGYGTAWYKHRLSPWCAAFDESTIKPLEYAGDLKQYWVKSYAYKLSYKQACVTVKHMFNTFVNKTNPKATFLFSHSGTMLKLLTHLQLYKPKEDLKWDTKPEDRTWKCSKIDSFANNLAFVLYKCKDGDYILTLHKERPIILPNCDKELCPLETVLKTYHSSIYDCDFTDLCRLNKVKTKDNEV